MLLKKITLSPFHLVTLSLLALPALLTRAEDLDRTTIKATASSYETKAKYHFADFPPEMALDGKIDAYNWWCAEGKGEWIQFDLGSLKTLSAVKIAFVAGDKRIYTFDLLVSKTGDPKDWTTLGDKLKSAGKTIQFESFPLKDIECRYVKIVGWGNSSEKVPNWINIAEVAFTPSTPTTAPATAASQPAK